MKTEAAQALTQAGFKKIEARQMVDEAMQRAAHDITLEQLVREALGVARRRFSL